jgi:hypothetical protein
MTYSIEITILSFIFGAFRFCDTCFYSRHEGFDNIIKQKFFGVSFIFNNSRPHFFTRHRVRFHYYYIGNQRFYLFDNRVGFACLFIYEFQISIPRKAV